MKTGDSPKMDDLNITATEGSERSAAGALTDEVCARESSISSWVTRKASTP